MHIFCSHYSTDFASVALSTMSNKPALTTMNNKPAHLQPIVNTKQDEKFSNLVTSLPLDSSPPPSDLIDKPNAMVLIAKLKNDKKTLKSALFYAYGRCQAMHNENASLKSQMSYVLYSLFFPFFRDSCLIVY